MNSQGLNSILANIASLTLLISISSCSKNDVVNVVYQINDIAVEGYWPEKVILLDIDPEVSLKRQKINDRIGSSELDFFKKVREGYLQLSEKFNENFLVVDATLDLTENSKTIYKWLELD